ncbi:flippase [Lactobacillus delbrueckii]|uniref:flippase n=1 Tax=Lactobacillus delbrueckii TaxID=1584 RepID=UPI001E324D6B|nr:flippase [Lactobacillus delbrueckii]MCD5457574.1 flippase [Lactobacillus delbrueckii subsp. bulgaricus]MCD5479991.1 flippase [Lactobacillus delbrueckii subsp. bulgaricus]MCT3517642.1 flippase [Lactobacillus delbrueckii subsp. bulgaricus]MCT3518341.1 flippase [Lactobacillus delbrueckii subsp. bulgaricus]
MKNRSLGKNAILNSIRQFLNLIFPLITLPYTSRVLSVSSMGIYNFSGNYANYFLLIASLGIPTYAVREGAKYRDDHQKISDFSSQIFTLNIISTMISYIILIFTLQFPFFKKYALTIVVLSLQIIFTTIGTEWIYTIYEDFTYITVRSILFKVLSIALLFVFVRETNDFLPYAGVIAFASVGSNILNYIHTKSIVKIRIINNFSQLKTHIKPVFTIFFSTLAINIYVTSDTTLLGFIKGNYAVGIYGVASKIYGTMAPFLASILIVTIPRLAMLFGKKNFKEYKNVLGSVIKVMVTILIPSSIGIIMLAPEIIMIISGKKYLASVTPLRFLAIALIFSLLNTIVSECVMIPAHEEKKMLKSNLIAASVNLILNLVLMPFFSFNAAAVTTVISELTSLSINTFEMKNVMYGVVRSEHILKGIIQSTIGCIPIVIICLLVKEVVYLIWLRGLVAIVLSIVAYVCVLLFMKNDAVLNLLSRFCKR